MNPHLQKLQPYPFEKLSELKQGITPPGDKPHIALSIGEPKHPTPHFIAESLIAHLHGLANYPATKGLLELRRTIADWLSRRFSLPPASVDPERHVLPCNGTREALFSFAQCVIDAAEQPLVLMPNPFYQIYEGAALLGGAEPYFLNTTRETGYLPDFESVPDKIWERCQLIYICSPGNPSGSVISAETHRALINLSERHDFIIASDECYSEIYLDESVPPPSLLQSAHDMGNTEFKRCVVFHSLSKRSNAPGLRSGFVAGDADILKQYQKYRTYHGCALSLPVQHASIKAWQDEKHVTESRAAYRRKFSAVHDVLKDHLDLSIPPGGFYLWPDVHRDDCQFAQDLYARQNLTVLPGSFLSREAHGINPGQNHVRIALVAPLEECVEAAHRIREFIQSM
ncbi:succinyldiaminopimelate transaminase [Methylocaldum gracile]|jgi:N-succinyldiaminopimelate aminotransferase|uniref:succinyldiaminopimelate transaminase n=1 Tax=unclassified Methylocaldum TaxID=2622260 RepID=UPI00105C9246